MSIRIVEESSVAPEAAHVPAVRRPAAAQPYGRRAARLRTLAADHAMADYLLWSAAVCDVQQQVAEALPLPPDEARRLEAALQRHPLAPLHSGRWARAPHWQALLGRLLALLAPLPAMQGVPVQHALAALQAASPAQREAWADALLADMRGEPLPPEAALPDPAVAQLLWTALSLYWRQLASALPAAGVAEAGEERHACPLCGHAPVGSLVLDGAQAGTRYLQCSLCECQWHAVRAKCTNCDGTSALDYWTLESEQAAIKAESCEDCHTYLKAFYLPADPAMDIVADDLASLALDGEMQHQGIERTGLNPLLLP